MFSDTSIDLVHRATIERIDHGDSARDIADSLVKYEAVQRIVRCEYAKCLRKLRLPMDDPANGIGIFYEYLLAKVRWELYEDLGAQKFRGYLARLAKCAILRDQRKWLRQRRAEHELFKAALRKTGKPANTHAHLQSLEELLLCASTAPKRLRQFMILMIVTGRIETTTCLMRLPKKTVKRYQRAAWKYFRDWRRNRERDDDNGGCDEA